MDPIGAIDKAAKVWKFWKWLEADPLHVIRRKLLAGSRHADCVRHLHEQVLHDLRTVIDRTCDALESDTDPGTMRTATERLCEDFYNRVASCVADVVNRDAPGTSTCLIWATTKPDRIRRFEVFEYQVRTHGTLRAVSMLAGGAGMEFDEPEPEDGLSNNGHVSPVAVVRGISKSRPASRDHLCPFWFVSACRAMNVFIEPIPASQARAAIHRRNAYVTDFDLGDESACAAHGYFDPIPTADRATLYRSVANLPIRLQAYQTDEKALAGFLWIDNPRKRGLNGLFKNLVDRSKYTPHMHFAHGISDACAAVMRIEALAVDEFAAREAVVSE